MTDEERCLWKWQTGRNGARANDSTSRPNLPCPTTTSNGDSGVEENYPFLLRKYATRATPVAWWRLCANAVVVVQEFVLVVYVLLVHRVLALPLASSSLSAVRQEDSDASTATNPTTTWDFDFFCAKRNDPVLLTMTTMIMVLTSLYLPVHVWSPLRRRSSISSWTAADWLVGPCVGAVMFRVVALALRYLMTLFFSLTDRQYCECAGMLIHLLIKDYSLANGMMMKRPETTDRDKMRPTTSLSLTELLSLKNVGIFSSLLANSQVDDSFLVGSYMAILIFVYYPRYQSDVAIAFPPYRSGTSGGCANTAQFCRADLHSPCFYFSFAMDDRRWGNMCRLYPLVDIGSALHCAVSRRRRRVGLCHSGLEVSFAQVQTIAPRPMGSTSEKVHEVVLQSGRSRHVMLVDRPSSVNALTALKLPFPSMKHW
jgi:hypothetical protein